MNRRHLLAAVAAGVAGCTGAPTDENATPTARETERPTETPTPTDGAGATATATPTQGREFNAELLVELYDLATAFRVGGDQHFEDGRSNWDGGDYSTAARRFTAAEGKYEDSHLVLERLTNRLTEGSLPGFRIADAAKSHVELMQRAATTYVQAAVATREGNQGTADSYRETAETFRTRANTHDVGSVEAFRAELLATQ